MIEVPYVTFALPPPFPKGPIEGDVTGLAFEMVIVPRKLAWKVSDMINEGGPNLRQRIEKLVADHDHLRRDSGRS